MWEFLNHSSPVARKNHQCDECSTAILKGDKYERIDGKWESEMTSHKSHLDCATLCSKIYDDGDLYPEEYPRLCDYVGDKEFQQAYMDDFKEVFERFGIL